MTQLSDLSPPEGEAEAEAGWYPDPLGAAHERWWDGMRWTPKTRRSLLNRVLRVIGVVGLLVGIAAGLVTIIGPSNGPPNDRPPTGQIISPASGDSVTRDIEVRGTLEDIPEDEHVWVIVRDGNLLYPQDSEVTPPDGEWSLSFVQGGSAKMISLELYRMGEEGHRFITDRLNAGNFSGTSQIPGAERLDAAENLRIQGQ